MDMTWVLGLVLLLFLCAAPLALAVAALSWLKRVGVELRGLRKQVAVLEVNQRAVTDAFRRVAARAAQGRAAAAATVVPPVTGRPVPDAARPVEAPAAVAPEPVAAGGGERLRVPVEEVREAAAAAVEEVDLSGVEIEPELEMAGAQRDGGKVGMAWEERREVGVEEASPFEVGLIRAAVWVGGLAFAMAGISLVTMAFGSGIGPALRVSAGTVFGMVLAALGVWRYRREPGVGQALSAAGVAVLFASFLAATNLYFLIPPVAGFVLLGATTALAVVLSLRQGDFVALLGLVGGFLTPALIRTEHPSVASLFGYLFLLHVGLLLVALARRCAWVALLTIAASQAWVLMWLVREPATAADGAVLGLYVVLCAVAVAFTAATEERRWSERPEWARAIGYSGGLAGVGLAALLVGRMGFRAEEWACLGLLTAGCFVLARLRPAYEALVWAAAVVVFDLLVWSAGQGGLPPARWEVVAGFGAAFTGGAYLMAWGSAAGSWMRVRWAVLSVAAGLAYTVLAYVAVAPVPRVEAWALLPLGLGGLYAIAAGRMRGAEGRKVAEVFSVGSLAALVLAPAMAVYGGGLTAAWAALVAVAAWMSWQLRVAGPRACAAAIAGVVGVRLVGNPYVFTYAGGPWLFWNEVVWGYVPSVAALAVGVSLLARGRLEGGVVAAEAEGAEDAVETVAVLSGLAFVGLMTHLAFHNGVLAATNAGVVERGTLGVVWLMSGVALLAMGWQAKRALLMTLGYVTVTMTSIYVIVGQGLVGNPLWTGEAVGRGPVVNAALVMFGLPMLLLWGLEMVLERRSKGDDTAEGFAPFVAIAGSITLLLWTGLEMRHAFAGSVLDVLQPAAIGGTLAERATYGIVWMALGAVLVQAGRRAGLASVRWAGFGLILAGVVCGMMATVLVGNPLRLADFVGRPVVANGLLYAYGLPALLAGALGVWLARTAAPGGRGLGEWIFGKWMQVVGIVFLFALVSLEVRQAFAGPVLNVGMPAAAELYAYSAAWALLGTLLLVTGIAVSAEVLRWMALVVLMVTVGKVFVFDTAGLSNLLRVMSFAGLGLTLTVLGLLYQYFVFRQPKLEGRGDAGGAVAGVGG